MLQDGRDGDRARADHRVDAQGRDQRVVGGPVDQGHRPLAAVTLGQQRGQDVDLVVVGDRDHGLGHLDIGLGQDIRIQGVAVEDHGVPKLLGRDPGLGFVDLDQLGVDAAVFAFDLAGHEHANVAAADNDDAPCLRLLVPEGAEGAPQMAVVDHEVDVVAR